MYLELRSVKQPIFELLGALKENFDRDLALMILKETSFLIHPVSSLSDSSDSLESPESCSILASKGGFDFLLYSSIPFSCRTIDFSKMILPSKYRMLSFGTNS